MGFEAWFSCGMLLCITAFKSTCFKRHSWQRGPYRRCVRIWGIEVTVSKVSNDRIVQRRLAAFLVMFTAPQSVVPTTISQRRCDRATSAKALDLVLEILLDAGLGLEAAPSLPQFSCNWSLPRILRAPKNGARFEIIIGLRGGYDFKGVIGATVVRSEAISFEALTMMLRSLAALKVIERV